MAICLRRVLRSHNPLSYFTLRAQQALLDQKNASSSSATAIEVNQGYLVPTIPNENIAYRSQFGSSSPNVIDKVKSKDTWKSDLTFVGNDLYCDKFYLSSMFEKDICYCAKQCEAYKKKESKKENLSPHLERPDSSQLQRVQAKLCDDLVRIFEKPLDQDIYHENMVFVNNIRGSTTVGIKNYMKQIAFLRLYASVLFSSVKFDILRSTTHEEDGTVRVRWRVRGVPGLKVIILFWKQKVWRQKDIQLEEGWFDGFSIFYVKSDGLVHKHVATKLRPRSGMSSLFNGSGVHEMCCKLHLSKFEILQMNSNYLFTGEIILSFEEQKENIINSNTVEKKPGIFPKILTQTGNDRNWIWPVNGCGAACIGIFYTLMPDDEGGITIVKNPLAARLALLTGFTSHELASESFLESDSRNYLINSNFHASQWNYGSFIPFITAFDQQFYSFNEETD